MFCGKPKDLEPATASHDNCWGWSRVFSNHLSGALCQHAASKDDRGGGTSPPQPERLDCAERADCAEPAPDSKKHCRTFAIVSSGLSAAASELAVNAPARAGCAWSPSAAAATALPRRAACESATAAGTSGDCGASAAHVAARLAPCDAD